jgi:hypothetical protein
MKLLWCLLVCVTTACSAQQTDTGKSQAVAKNVLQIGRIEHPLITESSGIVWSRKNPEVFWTHNDGGGRKQVLYAITRAGKPLADFRVTGALLEDWEDIASDAQGHLFLADTGNNDSKRAEIAVHRVNEPDLSQSRSGLVNITHSWRLRFPAKPFDCESLFVWRDFGYVISKVFNDAKAELYRFALTNSETQTLERLAQLDIDSPVTGADISQDGRLLGVVAKNGAYVFKIHGDPTKATKKPHFTKFKHEHVEACTFVPEGLLATAESREIYLFVDDDFIPRAAEKK